MGGVTRSAVVNGAVLGLLALVGCARPAPAEAVPPAAPPVDDAPAAVADDSKDAPTTDPDVDRDGILDAADGCPNAAEIMNGYEDTDGCPDDPPQEGRLLVMRPVLFAARSVEIAEDQGPELARTVEVLREMTGERVEVVGHADLREAEDEAGRVKLGLRRAEAVRGRLVKLGIAAERMTVRSDGGTRPLEASVTDSGRARNRRVEFLFVEANGRSAGRRRRAQRAPRSSSWSSRRRDGAPDVGGVLNGRPGRVPGRRGERTERRTSACSAGAVRRDERTERRSAACLAGALVEFLVVETNGRRPADACAGRASRGRWSSGRSRAGSSCG